MNNWVEWYEQPYAEDNAKLNDFIEDALRRISWHLFDKQEKIVYMANETDNGIPKMREGAIQEISQTVHSEFGWLVNYMVSRILVAYMKGNIEPSEEVKLWFEDDLLDPEEDNIGEFWKEINDYIWDDYVKVLGEERTAKLWEKWDKEPRKEN